VLCLLRDDKYDILAVCDWGQKMAFYQLNGKQVRGRWVHWNCCESAFQRTSLFSYFCRLNISIVTANSIYSVIVLIENIDIKTLARNTISMVKTLTITFGGR